MENNSYNLSRFNVLLYLRKSRSDNPDMTIEEVLLKHEEMLQEWSGKHLGGPIPEKNIFREVLSGETISLRPSFQKILRLIESSEIKGVLVIEPQRLSRGDLEDCGRIINLFRYSDTLVLTPMMTFNLSNDYDRKAFETELTRGNDYLEYFKKIQSRGRYASTKRGNYIGSRDPYGYRRVVKIIDGVKCHTLEPVPDEAQAIVLIHELYAYNDMGCKKIAQNLDELGIKPPRSDYWSPATILDIICKKLYLGYVTWNSRPEKKEIVNGKVITKRPVNPYVEYFPGHHEAIISEKLYNDCLKQQGKHPRIHRGTTLMNPLAGLLYCGTCGYSMSRKITQNKKYPVSTSSFICIRQTSCHTKSVLYDALFNRVIESLESAISDFEIKLKSDDGNDPRTNFNIIHGLEAQLEKLHLKDARQKDAYEDGIYTKAEFVARNKKLQEEIYRTTTAIEKARRSITPIVDYKEKIARFTDCVNALNNPDLPPAEKNSFLHSCIERIDYYNKMESKAGIGKYVENIFELKITFK